MPYINYKPAANAGPEELVNPIRERRGGSLLNIDLMLLHSEPLVKGWGAFLGPLRRDLSLPYALRELVICCVSALKGASYELHHHRSEFLQSGMTAAQFELLIEQPKNAYQNNDLFNPTEQAVMNLCVDITLNGKGSETTLKQAELQLNDDTQLVELVALISAYNMVAGFITTLGIEPETQD